MKIRLYIFFILILFFASHRLFAQSTNNRNNSFSNNLEVNYNIGFSQFYGDASSSGFFQKFSGELGIGHSIHIKKHLNPVLALGINGYYGCANSHKTTSASGAAVDFYLGGGYGDINFRAYLDFNSLFAGYNKKRKLSFYGWLGLGYAFWSTGLTDNFTSDYRESGDVISGTTDTYKKGGGVVPLGFGVDYRISENWSVNAVGDYRTILNDDLDVWRGGFEFDNLFFVGIGVSYHINPGFGKRKTKKTKSAPKEKQKEEDIKQKDENSTVAEPKTKIISDVPIYELDYNSARISNQNKGRIREQDNLVIETKVSSTSTHGLVYRVQIMAKSSQLSNTNYLRNKYNLTDNILEVKQDGIYRYSVGSFQNYTLANEYCRTLKNKGINDAFVVVYNNGRRISLTSELKK